MFNFKFKKKKQKLIEKWWKEIDTLQEEVDVLKLDKKNDDKVSYRVGQQISILNCIEDLDEIL